VPYKLISETFLSVTKFDFSIGEKHRRELRRPRRHNILIGRIRAGAVIIAAVEADDLTATPN
jgi:hypothetical protein